MKKIISSLLFLASFLSAMAQSPEQKIIDSMFAEALAHGQAYHNLDYLCNKIGGRPAGSPQAAAAVEWARQTMVKTGCYDTVYLQEVKVPHWVRGEKEQGAIISGSFPGGSVQVPVCALGGSLATATDGLTAEVVEVKNFEELKSLGKKVKGKIVFYNRPMDPTLYTTFEAYGGAVDQRGIGAREAGKLGAVGVIVRSMTVNLDDIPHTGAMYHDTNVVKIPAAAISTNGAELLSKSLKKDPSLKFYLKMGCYYMPDVISYNVIGEMKGSEKPDEYITVGGHLDSWDLAQGAHDDGTGCVQSMEVGRLFKTVGIRPKRTLRVVMFMNEEFGLNGGTRYAEAAKEKNEKLFLAVESDAGGFCPHGFSVDTSAAVVENIAKRAEYLKKYGIYAIEKGGSGADVYTLKNQGAIAMELHPDSQRYFDYHHTMVDTFDKVNARELHLGAASMAALIYLLDKDGVQ